MNRFAKVTFACFVAIPLCIAATASYADWPSWRGPNDRGSIETGKYPSSLDDANLTWKTPLPGKGCSTPIISDGLIFVTAPIDRSDALLCFDTSGKRLWHAQFGIEVGGKHRNGSGSNSSPVSDGESIFVYFKSGTLASVDREGKVQWKTNIVEKFGKDTLFWDYGSSPVLTDKHVVITRMHQGDSWLAAFDKETGNMDWKVDRNYKTPVECDHGYSTPLVIDYENKQCLLVWGAEHVTLHDASDGKNIWTCGDFNPENNKLWPSIATPVIVKDRVVIAYGRNDRNIPRLHGVRLSGLGDVTDSNHVWDRDDIGTFVPTPVAYKERVYMVRDRGEIECIDPKDGTSIWSDRLPKGRAKFYASPLIAGGVLYAPREDGVVFMGNVSEKGFTFLSQRDMGEPVIGSPVPMGNEKILIRGEKSLYCFGK